MRPVDGSTVRTALAITSLGAERLAQLIACGELGALELGALETVEAHIERMEEVHPRPNP